MSRYDVIVVGLGALGSATAWHLARRGVRVLGLEKFELGHNRGASHDTSRILRHSYHTPAYVRLTKAAYDDWADLEAESGQTLVTVTGGVDLFPADPAIPMADYVESLTAENVEFTLLDADEVAARWPVFSLPAGTTALFQERGAIVPAGPGTATMQQRAVAHGATLVDRTPVLAVESRADGTTAVVTAAETYLADKVVVTADAWTNQVLAGLGVSIPLTTTLEQVTYFALDDPAPFRQMPLWIWMDDPSFYGFPCYGEDTVKAAQDCGGPTVDPDRRTFDPDPQMQQLLADHLHATLQGVGDPIRSLRCHYTMTPDRDFLLDVVPNHPNVAVGLGSAHAFKFAPTLGRLLADLVTTGADPEVVHPFRFDRPALTDPAYETHWLV